MQFTVREVTVTVTPVILIALVLGLGIAGYGGFDYVQQSNAVDDAVAVETTVVDTDISRSDGRRFYYRISVEHTYEYQGREYTSERVFPGSTRPIYTVQSDAQRIIEPYEPNETATAYVDRDSPGRAFLERQTTFTPFKFIGTGSLIALLTTLHAIGARNPGQNTGISRTSERKPTRYSTVFGFNRDTLSRVSTRLMLFTPAVFFISLVTTVALLLNSEGPSLQVSMTNPAGFALLAALLSVLGFIFGLTLYGIWSFTEYRRLRERIPEPRPPSPFRHPSRLVSIMHSRDDLDVYGHRVKLTGFVFTLLGFLIGVVAFVLVTAS
jgi:hypothetical protein